MKLLLLTSSHLNCRKLFEKNGFIFEFEKPDTGSQDKPVKLDESKEQKDDKEIARLQEQIKAGEKLYNTDLQKLKTHKDSALQALAPDFVTAYTEGMKIIEEKKKREKFDKGTTDNPGAAVINNLESVLQTLKEFHKAFRLTQDPPLVVGDVSLPSASPEMIKKYVEAIGACAANDPGTETALDTMPKQFSFEHNAYEIAQMTKDYLSESQLHDLLSAFVNGKDALAVRYDALRKGVRAIIDKLDINPDDKKNVLKRLDELK